MTPGELAAFALEKADLRNARRQVRLFHPVAGEEADREFLAAVTAAAAGITAEPSPSLGASSERLTTTSTTKSRKRT